MFERQESLFEYSLERDLLPISEGSRKLKAKLRGKNLRPFPEFNLIQHKSKSRKSGIKSKKTESKSSKSANPINRNWNQVLNQVSLGLIWRVREID